VVREPATLVKDWLGPNYGVRAVLDFVLR